jgi:hypothetical protein
LMILLHYPGYSTWNLYNAFSPEQFVRVTELVDPVPDALCKVADLSNETLDSLASIMAQWKKLHLKRATIDTAAGCLTQVLAAAEKYKRAFSLLYEATGVQALIAFQLVLIAAAGLLASALGSRLSLIPVWESLKALKRDPPGSESA